jgi:hypothetical protein
MSFVLASMPAGPDHALHMHTKELALPWEEWHQHYCHVSYSGLKEILRQHLADSFLVNISSSMLDCVAYTEAKMTTSPYGPSEKCFTHVGELTHVNLWGKYDKASIHRNLYYLLLVNDASQFITVKFLKSKTQAIQKIKDYMSYLLAHGKSPCAIRMDHGLEFINEDLHSWCHSKGMRFQMMAPYSPSQNSVAEHMNHTLGELSCTILITSKLPEFLWEPAVAHAAYVHNMFYTKYIPNATPYQFWHEQKPNVAHLCEFGVPVWVLQQGQ